MSDPQDTDRARREVVRILREEERFLTVTHEHPDGDALGSLVAATRTLRSLGKDVRGLVRAQDLPVPREYAGLAVSDLETEVPADLAERTVLALDCGNLDRVSVRAVREGARRIVNVDHHHDNTCFGDVDLVDPTASCTAEILWDLLPDLGLEADLETAEALYVGLVTDTGRFMYENTGGRAHLMAADLLGAGVEPQQIHRALYEDLPWAKLALRVRALSRVRLELDGRLAFVLLRRADYEESGARDADAEGIVDELRAISGVSVAAVARELGPASEDPGDASAVDEHGGRTKVSLRAVDGLVDVSSIARRGGGGGHPQAAGFATRMGEEDLVAFLREHAGAAG